MISNSFFIEETLKKDKFVEKRQSPIASKKHTDKRPIEFSACAMIKDENNNLLEWTAYHYYMINLRHLVLCIDPNSVSDPMEKLERWKSMGMTIDIWTRDIFALRVYNKNPLHKYVFRQQACFKSCLLYFKNQNRTWTIFTDPDEYITFNPTADDDEECIYDKVKQNNDPELPHYKVVYDEKNCSNDKVKNSRFLNNWKPLYPMNITKDLWRRRTLLPSHLGSKTIADYLYHEDMRNFPWNLNCIVLPRLQFGNVEETNQDILHKDILTGFNSANFSTLTFFSYGKKNDIGVNGWGKCIVDVSRVDEKDMTVISPHYILRGCGDVSRGWAQSDVSLFRVNHYAKSREAFYSKSDFRRIETMYEKLAKQNNSTSYEMQGWLKVRTIN